MLGDTPFFEAQATGYHPVDEADPNYSMEGGFKDRQGRPVYTLDAYRRGEAPYVTVAGDPSIPYGSVMRSPQFPKTPFVVADTGSDFEGKGLSRFDIARDSAEGADSDENNRKIQFQFTELPAPLKTGLFSGSQHVANVANSPATQAMNKTNGSPAVAAAFHNPLADRILQQALLSATQTTTAQLGNYAAGNGLNTGNPANALQELARYMGKV